VEAMVIETQTATLAEWDYSIKSEIQNPFELELNTIITTPEKKLFKIPAFYRGNGRWSVRFMPKEAGEYSVVTECKEPTLNEAKGTLNVVQSGKEYPRNPQLSSDKKYLA
jgi:hypothetical protein